VPRLRTHRAEGAWWHGWLPTTRFGVRRRGLGRGAQAAKCGPPRVVSGVPADVGGAPSVGLGPCPGEVRAPCGHARRASEEHSGLVAQRLGRQSIRAKRQAVWVARQWGELGTPLKKCGTRGKTGGRRPTLGGARLREDGGPSHSSGRCPGVSGRPLAMGQCGLARAGAEWMWAARGPMRGMGKLTWPAHGPMPDLSKAQRLAVQPIDLGIGARVGCVNAKNVTRGKACWNRAFRGDLAVSGGG